jgi:hypothetical protein
MIPWLLARESRQPFFLSGCEKAVSPMVSLMLFRTFFIAFSAAVMCSHPKFPMQR